MTSVHDPDALAPEQLASLREDYDSDSRYRLMQNAVTGQDVDSVALDRTTVTDATHTFSTSLDDWTPTDQGASGRCWLFSGLNLCRVDTMNEMNSKAFEFSQSYLIWSFLERGGQVGRMSTLREPLKTVRGLIREIPRIDRDRKNCL